MKNRPPQHSRVGGALAVSRRVLVGARLVLFGGRRAFGSLACLALVCALAPALRGATPQRREALTPQEIEKVRDAQQLDARTSLFVKIAERRLRAVAGERDALPTTGKDAGDWGALPKGTRAEYLSDLARILDEAIENIDDTASRNPQSELLGPSLRKLAEAAARFTTQLLPLRETAQGRERESLEQSLDNLEQIIEAAKKLPEEPADKKGGKKKGDQ